MTEFELISKIASQFSQCDMNGWEGIGDDCAVLPISDGKSLVISTDMLVEDIHFLRNAATPYEIGYKSLAVNVSDVCAMGARPTAALLSLSLPEDVMQEWVAEFMEGFSSLCKSCGVALVGGDTTASKERVTINVTIIGEAPSQNIKRRSAAKAGDLVVVNDKLGASGAGLRDILGGRCNTPEAQAHKMPRPMINEAVWLGSCSQVHAMMDISDGVASDVRHIMERSRVGAEIELAHIPTDYDIETALCAGEDYKLLMTISEDGFDRVAEEYFALFGERLYAIGHITDSCGELRWVENGKTAEVDFRGFVHY